MARRSSTPPTPPPVVHTRQSLQQGIERLRRVLASVQNYDVNSYTDDDSSTLQALNAEVGRAIERTFGEGTSDASRYSQASNIQAYHSLFIGGGPTPIHELRNNITQDKRTSAALLQQAIQSLEGDLAEMGPDESAAERPQAVEPRNFTNRVFIVHGRADGPKETVARFLESLQIQAIILHEQPSQGRSVIEKIETYGDVDFAVVIMTPDDIGGLADAPQQPRARQNVIFELGYFIGKLGRPKVCAIRQGNVEMLTDYVGPIWVDFDGAGAWRQALGQELEAAGFSVDWNTIMRGRRSG